MGSRIVFDTRDYHKYEDIIFATETLLAPLSRVLSLTDAKNKMSKSDPIERSRISLSDSKDEIASKIARAKTDSVEGVSYDDINRPELANLIRIFSELSGRYIFLQRASNNTHRGIKDICSEYQNKNMKEFKTGLTDAVVGTLGPISDKIRDYEQNLDFVEAVLKKGAEKATEISYKNMEIIRNRVGLV